MPLLTYTQRWRDLINKVFVGKRQGLSDITVLDDVFPTFSLVNEAQGEFHLPRGEITFGATNLATASLGNLTKWAIVNNTDDRMVAVESIRISGTSTADFWTVAHAGSDLSGSYAAQAINRYDARGAGTSGGGGLLLGAQVYFGRLQDAVAMTISPIALAYIGQSKEPVELLSEDVILRPRSSVVVYSTATNIGGVISASGYSRAIEPQEF